MLVEIGNVSPVHADGKGGTTPLNLGYPSVTYVHLPDSVPEEGQVGYDFDPTLDVAAFKEHLYDATLANRGITSEPGSEALLAVVHVDGLWQKHSDAKPSWVWSDNPVFARLLGSYFKCSVGRPDDVEDTHLTRSGPPGVKLSDGPTALITNNGRNKWALMEGGGGIAVAGATATATSSTTLTNSGASYTSNQFVNCVLVAGSGSGAVYGNIISNTATVITIDRWNNFATPGGVAGSTPGSTTTYNILAVSSPAQFGALSPTSITPALGDTTLSGEITTSSGGLIRKIATWAHTAGAASYTQTLVYTANGSDSLPVTVQSGALFDTIVVGNSTSMMFEDSVSPTATLSASGDQLTLTFTVTGS